MFTHLAATDVGVVTDPEDVSGLFVTSQGAGYQRAEKRAATKKDQQSIKVRLTGGIVS